jgi:hypothetical protein
MVIGFKNFTAICAILLLTGASGWNNTAIASISNQCQLIAQGSVRTRNSQPHGVFQPILPKLRQKTRIPIILPKVIPGSEGENQLYAILEAATPRKYDILLGFSPNCTGGTACRFGVVTAATVTRKTPRLTGRPVSLAKGITGYFVDFSCGANCSDATLTWRQQGVQYMLGLKAGDRNSLVKMANSAINSN